MNKPDLLFLIRGCCMRTIDHTESALTGMLCTSTDYTDNPEARVMLTKVLGSAKTLLAHLEKFYEFGYGVSEPREASCPE